MMSQRSLLSIGGRFDSEESPAGGSATNVRVFNDFEEDIRGLEESFD